MRKISIKVIMIMLIIIIIIIIYQIKYYRPKFIFVPSRSFNSKSIKASFFNINKAERTDALARGIE